MPRSDVALGLIQGPAELLPVSSSGHVEAARLVLGLEGDEVGLHAGSLAALVLGCRGEAVEILRRLTWRRVGMHLCAGAIPAALGYAQERRARRAPTAPRRAERRFRAVRAARNGRSAPAGDPARRRLAAGMVSGAALLASADRARGERSRWDAGVADGVWLGCAQAAALWPGVSRNGATLAVARWRGFAPAEANRLSREVGVPVTLGAVALRRAPVTAGTVAAFASALAALPALRLVDGGGPLWPWAAERVAVALLCLRAPAGDAA